ncbi:hypothetical protein PVK06_030650 [Gossypium arboreum]|uniref:PHD-type domain-containing protein n=1 Tax=Gossypium arboreum TaxID=29729 RepID=A0ABR0NNU6_GOSAR|nr:hypothetical protein PVK06_030650 [Gossypium arboreum]
MNKICILMWKQIRVDWFCSLMLALKENILRFQCWMELLLFPHYLFLFLIRCFQVDSHIQQLDQYLKMSDDELRRERENAATASPVPSPNSTTKFGRSNESGRGGRKKTRLATAAAAAAAAAEVAAAAAENPTGMELDLPVDPNEPTYCLCNQVSYGEMVACDNPNCKIEWFHFGCVGLKEQPRGKWYCPDCAALKNRRKGRSR